VANFGEVEVLKSIFLWTGKCPQEDAGINNARIGG
jgi:hypothetical protein